jgi:twitching motility protein PilT
MSQKSLDLNLILKTMLEQGASDLHITVGAPPAFRINGQIVRVKMEPLNPEDTKSLCYSLINEGQRKKFEENKELDFSFGVKDVARFRGNLFIQRGAVAGVFRRIYSVIPPLSTLGFRHQVEDLVNRPHGLVLVTGATGSGKSTTLASMLDQINVNKRVHVVTIEDPIEFTHTHKKAIFNQREVGTDCESFGTALRQVLREDPDVIMVGEMRDKDTAEAALKAAETGHLVFSTLHTNGALNSINRIVQMFGVDEQEYIRSLLSFCLEAIVSQCLIETIDAKRIMAYEFLTLTPAIRNLVRTNKLHQIYSQMQIGQDQSGMITLNQTLYNLVFANRISLQAAYDNSPDMEELQRMFEKSGKVRKAS